MAYDFLQAEGRSFLADNLISSVAPPFTLSIRQNYPNITATRGVCGIYTSGSTSNNFNLQNNANGTLQVIAFETSDPGSPSVTLPGADIWWNALGLYASTTSRKAYANTTAGAEVTTSRNVTGVNSLVIGRRGNNIGVSFTGKLAEFAIWNVALTDAEINSLSQGFKPSRIRPQSLLYYVPLVRNVQELYSGIPFTASATAPTVFDHPRVY
jgi:hypothetical protein